MREAFVRFGDQLFLDFMKREMNHLHWAYHGPCVLTEELEVQVVCEGLFIEESLPTYAFALNFILDKERRRRRDSILIVYGDCMLSSELFKMVGLCNALCIWDHFHLLKKVWPEKFGPHVFAKLENGLRGMLGAESPAAFEEAFQHVRRHLLSDPVNLDYIKTGFYHHPEKFATFKINEVEGSMERKGDTPAEQNHSSIVSHLGNGSCQPIENQIMKLFTRQKELLAKRNTATARYNLVCDNLAAEESDPSEEEAILVLSNYAYNQIWETEKQESMYYTRQVLEDGSTRVHRKGAPAASARVIAPGERCNCVKRKGWGIQCRHEGDKFDKNKWSYRWFKRGALPTEYWECPLVASAPPLLPQLHEALDINLDDAIKAMQDYNDDATPPALLMPTFASLPPSMSTPAPAQLHPILAGLSTIQSTNVPAPGPTVEAMDTTESLILHSADGSQSTNALVSSASDPTENQMLHSLRSTTVNQSTNVPAPGSTVKAAIEQPLSVMPRKKPAIPKVTHSTLTQKCSELASVASKARQETMQYIQGAIIALTRVARGECSGVEGESRLTDVVLEAEQAIKGGFTATYRSATDAGIDLAIGSQSTKSSVALTSTMPVSGRAPRPGPIIKRRIPSATMAAYTTGAGKASSRKSTKAKCSFCHQDDGHKVTGCQVKKRFGIHLYLNQITTLTNRLIIGHGIKDLPDGVVTTEKPVLNSVPPNTQWLVVHGMYFLNNNPHPESFKRSPLNYGVLVTCLGAMGNPLDNDQYSKCVIKQNAVTTWISAKHNKKTTAQGLSKVFMTADLLT
jgi:hypothetical protein